MSSISRRGPYQWRAQVRRQGYPTQVKTFETRKDAEDWARNVENEMRQGVFTDRSDLERTTLADLLIRYSENVTPSKKSQVGEEYLIKRLLRHPLTKRTLASLRASDFAAYRDARSKNF